MMIAEKPQPLDIRPDASVVVVTGAGVSAESGIATFRDKDGIWHKYDLEKVATPRGFEADPHLVWRFYSERREQVAKCQPNPGHYALVALEHYLENRGRFLLVTQNVDGLHQRAGSKRVISIHGSLMRTRCSNLVCDLEPFDDERSYKDGAPRCPRCGSWLRPDVVWFGEYLDAQLERQARLAIAECDIFLAVGTSGVVYPVAGYVEIAAAVGAWRILVNLEVPSNAQSFNSFFQGKSGELLPVLLAKAIEQVGMAGGA